MATKQYFGEGAATTTRKTKRTTTRKRKVATRRTKRATTRTTTTLPTGVVMIPVPASLAFQIGLALGRGSTQTTTTR